jgi:hypothetical protein
MSIRKVKDGIRVVQYRNGKLNATELEFNTRSQSMGIKKVRSQPEKLTVFPRTVPWSFLVFTRIYVGG